jgi:hypothetical protein
MKNEVFNAQLFSFRFMGVVFDYFIINVLRNLIDKYIIT